MAVIDFKSIGESTNNPKFQPVLNERPIGIKTPLRFGDQHDSIFGMNIDLGGQISDNFRNMLLTNHGERLGRFDFGASLKELSFEYGKDEFDAEAIRRIRRTTNRYMPFISLRTFESSVHSNDTYNGIARIVIRILYDVPRLGFSNKAIELSVYVGG